MTHSQKKKCHAIIHSASAAAAGVGAGLANIPGGDLGPLATIQLTMAISLGTVFGRSLDQTAAQAVLKSLGGTAARAMAGKAATQVAVSAWIGIGNIINGTTAAAVTEAVGWAIASDFDKDSKKKKV